MGYRQLLLGALLLFPTVALGQAKPAAPAAAPAGSPVDAAVAALVAEANECFVPEPKKQMTIVRPHPAVAKLQPRDAFAVLKAMAGPLAGDPYRNVYVRYHLMDVVNRALDSAAEPFTAELMKLAGDVPNDVTIELRPWHTYDPPDIGKRYHDLYWSTAVQIGFPPFHRTVWAPESFQYMDGAKRAKAEAAWAEAQTLKGKFREVDAPQNHLWNWRAIWLNWVVRQYRGELVYAMVAQGDAKAFDMIVDAIVAAAATDPVRATDYASFLNAAFFNGFLGKYPQPALKQAAAKLKAAAVASERAAQQKAAAGGGAKAGPTVSVGWVNTGSRWRQVPEALFTLVYAIENDRIPQPIPTAERVRPVVAPAPKPKPATKPATGPATEPAAPPPITPENITLEQIDAAIAKGVAALDTLRPPDVDLSYLSYAALKLPNNYWHSDFTLPGQGALATWAMLSTGESELSTWMKRRINWVLTYDSPTTYDRAMRLRLLSKMNRPDLAPWIHRDALWMGDTMTAQGNWEQRNTGARSQGFGDNANGQYAVLGLWAAAEAGVPISDAIWAKVDRYWREGQRPPGAPGDGAWAVTSSAALKKGANLNAFTNQVSASMTAGGVLSLYLTEMYLQGHKRVDVGQSLSPELLRGIQWLDDNFSLDKLDGDSDFYFYAWTIQNVGQATGYRTFNDVDWFRTVAARLLNTQGANGLWAGPKGPHVSTSFALLYLARARGPLAICKVRFDPTVDGTKPKPAAAAAQPKNARAMAKANAWNNRPNDLYNFVTDLSKRTEVPTSWQIVDLDQPLHELTESTVLYLATDKPFKLSPDQVARLREYVDAGGLLVCVPEGKSTAAPLNSMKQLAAEVCPGVEPVRRTTGDHPFYSLQGKPKVVVPTLTYETAIRPRVVLFEGDIGRGLQANDPKDRDAFSVLTNVYLFAAGMDTKRPRIVTNYVPQPKTPGKVKFSAARVKTNDNFDPEPLALPQLRALLGAKHDVDLAVTTATPEELSPATKFAFLTIGKGTDLSEAQIAALTAWTKAGGTLWVDAAGGSIEATTKVVELLAKAGWNAERRPLIEGKTVASSRIVTGEGLKGGQAIGSGAFRRFSAGIVPRVTATFDGDRPMVIAVHGDLTSGLAGMNHWGIAGLTAPAARQLVVNAVLVETAPPPVTKPTTGPATRPGTQPATQPTTPSATQPAAAPVTLPASPATQPAAAK